MNNSREIKCPFGLLNISGLMTTKPIKELNEEVGAETVVPLFCHESYKIKPTFNRKLEYRDLFLTDEDGEIIYDVDGNPIKKSTKDFGILRLKDKGEDDGKFYQKKFRRMVLWDFGDGHSEEGYSVEHYYTKPGRYRISCTFYDINRVAWKNTYHIDVVVKEVIPTKLSFVKNLTKDSICCSKIERITQIEAMLSLTCKEDLQLQAKRIFSDVEEDAPSPEIGRDFKEVPDEIFKFSRKYWTFLENERQLVFQSDTIFGDNLIPNDLYTPSYISLYGKFVYNEEDENNPIDLKIYQVIPYLKIDSHLEYIKVMNPNIKLDDFISFQGTEEEFEEKFIWNLKIIQKYVDEQLPKDVFFIGKRAFVDIFYKNDFLSGSTPNKFSFFYDIERKNITKELLSSDNYLNINPLGLKISVVGNNINKVKVGMSLDGFLRELNEGDDWTQKSYYIDPYLLNGLVKGINLDMYVFPYIPYDNDVRIIEGTDIVIEEGTDMDFILSKPMYYVPKDFTIQNILVTDDGLPNKNYNGIESRQVMEIGQYGNGQDSIEDWLCRIQFSLQDYIYTKIKVQINGRNFNDMVLDRASLIKPDNIIIPTEKMVNESISELIDTYMVHPMFDVGYSVENKNSSDEGKRHTTGCSIKEFFKLILSGNNMLNYALTKSNHFIDDYSNIKTCYLSSLIQTLKMMGEDIYEYEKGAFEGVNDLRDFVRILSMNHSDLVGHVVNSPYDLTIRLDRMGKNVGDEIKVDDVLTLQINDTNNNKGKILSLTRNGKKYDLTQVDKNGVDLIIHDKYTFKTKIVNLRAANKGTISLLDYHPSWGWNLLLPKRFQDCIYKLDKNEEYKNSHNGQNLYSASEINRIKQTIKEQLQGYYAFYVLDPNVEKVRKGNFLDERTITDEIDDVEAWDAEWGIAHEILMKILRDNGNLKNSEVVIQDDSLMRNTKSRTIIFDDSGLTGLIDDEIVNIRTNFYKDGISTYDKAIDAIVSVYGYICGGEEDYLELQLNNARIFDEKYSFQLKTEEPILQFNLKIDEDGVIHPSKQIYKLSSDCYEGYLNVSLCGKLSKNKGKLEGFLWDVSIDLFSIK